eukprot:UN02755
MFARSPAVAIQRQVLQQTRRAFHEPAAQRKWIQQYDAAVVEKYPKVLDHIKGNIPRSQLNTTERTALFVSTYGTGLPGAKRIRQRERRLVFEGKVNALVKSWQHAEFLQRKENVRKAVIQKAKSQRLSTYKENVNAPKFQMEFKATRYD